jgi:hypothetical protein
MNRRGSWMRFSKTRNIGLLNTLSPLVNNLLSLLSNFTQDSEEYKHFCLLTIRWANKLSMEAGKRN